MEKLRNYEKLIENGHLDEYNSACIKAHGRAFNEEEINSFKPSEIAERIMNFRGTSGEVFALKGFGIFFVTFNIDKNRPVAKTNKEQLIKMGKLDQFYALFDRSPGWSRPGDPTLNSWEFSFVFLLLKYSEEGYVIPNQFGDLNK